MTLSQHRLTHAYVLDLGLFDVGPGKREIGIPGFVLKTDQGAWILVDTGFDAAYVTDYAATDARDGLSGFGRLLGFSAAQTVTGQLALLGITPADISALVLTHGHIDHVGGLPLFAHCPIYLTTTERAAPAPLYWGDVRPIAWPDTIYHPIDTETELCAGITLIPTPGHTPGHLSLLLHLPHKTLILAADAINRASEPAENFSDAIDPATAAASAKRLMELAQTFGAEVIFGHDPAQWQTLPKAPAAL